MTTYLKSISRQPLLTPAEEKELGARSLQGDLTARRELVERNLRLVVNFAKQYYRHSDFMDLIQEGNLGLIRAAEKYDPAVGTRFSTYAWFWIQQGIFRYFKRERTIRLPESLVETMVRCDRVEEMLHQELGREPTEEELAVEMGMTTEKMLEMQQHTLEAASLDTMLVNYEGEETHLQALVPSVLEDLARQTDLSLLTERFGCLMVSLPSREQLVVERRFGLNEERPHTLEEVSHLLCVSRERIRQIEQQALGRLRSLTAPQEAVA